MRVAVLEPLPRTSGVTTYTQHLAEGFRRAGCQTDLVTFTLSGKPASGTGVAAMNGEKVRSGWQWSPLKPDRFAAWRDAASVLDEYDLVFLNEPRCAPLDKKAMRKLGKGDIKIGRERVRSFDLEEADLPEYIAALRDTTTPWVTCMHDPGYGPKLAPFLAQLLDVAPPSLVVTHRAGALESAGWAQEAAGVGLPSLHRPHLPFAFEPSARESWTRVVGATGRYINNKGQPTVLGLAAYNLLPRGWSAEVGGASPLGAGPNHTFLTFEALQKLGWWGKRDGNGNVTTGDPWRAGELEGVIRAEYFGPYDDGQAYSLRHGVHVNATEVNFSGSGSLEYADLEALASGALLVLPHHRNELGTFIADHYELTKCLNAELAPVDEARDATLRSLAGAVLSAAASVEQGWARETAEANWATAREACDPQEYAEAVLQAALG